MRRPPWLAALLLAAVLLAGCASAPASLPSATPSALPTLAATASATATVCATPTPMPTPTPAPRLEYRYDPYALPGNAKAYLGESGYRDYKRLVDAVTARAPKITFSSQKTAIAVLSCLYAGFPPVVLLSDYTMDKKGLVMTPVYRYDAGEHAQRVRAFEARVDTVMRETVEPRFNRTERILALYRFVAANIVYRESDDVSVYNALMNGAGICQSYAGALRFLLIQLGIDSLDAGSFMAEGQAHEWVLVQLGGAWYHLDPTFESTTNGGAGLQFFGMDDRARLASGAVKPFGTGVDGWYKKNAPACKDGRFASFSDVTGWRFDTGSHRILLTHGEGQQEWFDTEKFASMPAETPEPTATATPAPVATAVPTMTPTPTPAPRLDYQYDPYALPEKAKSYIGQAGYKEYHRLIDAIVSRAPDIRFGSRKAASDAMACLAADFPLDILLSGFSTDKKGLLMTLEYRYDADEHAACVRAFEARVDGIIRETIEPRYNRTERILALYRFTAKHIAYVGGDDVSAYNALMNGAGICSSYTGALRFLLLQAGVDSLDVCASMSDGGAHEWVLVQMGGAWFHLDPTFESGNTGGDGLRYFGMDDKARIAAGVVKPFAVGTTQYEEAPACKDGRFAAFADVTGWRFDAGSHRILLTHGEGQQEWFDTE